MIWNEVLLNWMGGEFRSGYCISISKGKAVGNLRRISGLLDKVLSLLIAEDVYVGRYPLQSASSLGCNYSTNKGNYIQFEQLLLGGACNPRKARPQVEDRRTPPLDLPMGGKREIKYPPRTNRQKFNLYGSGKLNFHV
ncbi:hypothetical protein TNCV_4457181 [Trichonephila clavipes]|nr:hypothetical protein TNCV_4457181 [Trichonephila clavipes]